MSLKKTFKKQFGNAEKRIDVLYVSSKIVFFVTTLLFFFLYYCISSGFYAAYLTIFFLPVYLSFLMSLTFYVCAFSIRWGMGKIPRPIIMLFCAICLGVGAVFILPVL